MKTNILFISSMTFLILLTSLCYSESNDGAKALFFGNTTEETVEIKKTASGAAAFSGTEIKKGESFSATNTQSTGKISTAQPHHNNNAKIAKLATGLSYWIEVIQPNGKVDKVTAESKIFRSGERIRFVFKSNKEGHLYLLSIGASGRGTVLFPDQRINEGKNLVAQNTDYKVPFGEKSFVMDATAGEERVLVFFSETEINDIRDYFIGKDKNRQLEVKDTQKLYVYAQSNGSKDIVFEEDALDAGLQPASYVVTKSSDPKSIIFKEIKLKHK
jgi:hypothetical protein